MILDRALINATGKCLLGVKFGYSCSVSSYFVTRSRMETQYTLTEVL